MSAELLAKPQAAKAPDVVSEPRPVYIYPPVQGEAVLDLRATVLNTLKISGNSKRSRTAASLTQEADRSVLFVAQAALDGAGSDVDLLQLSSAVAEQTERRNLRFGWQGENMLIGFNSPLSAAEIKACEKRLELKRETKLTFDEPTINQDGSATYATTNSQEQSYPARMRAFQENIFGLMVPQLSGVVACRAAVFLVTGDEPSLFQGNSPAARSAATESPTE